MPYPHTPGCHALQLVCKATDFTPSKVRKVTIVSYHLAAAPSLRDYIASCKFKAQPHPQP